MTKDKNCNFKPLLFALLSSVFCLFTFADTYPTKSITFVIPSSAGGSPDTIGRLVATKLSEALKQPVIVENVVGASGIIGTDKVAKARPDGYTLLYGFNQLSTINPHMFQKLPFVFEKDFDPVIQLVKLSYIWVSAPDFKANSVKEWINLAKTSPGKISYASNGPGSAPHLGGELLNQMANIDMLHVPYKTNTIPPDLLSGRVDVKMEPATISIPMIKSGHLKALAISGNKRIDSLPNVPSMAEFVTGYDITGWQAIWAPAGTPKEVITRLNTELQRIINLPDLQARFSQISGETVGGPPSVLNEATRVESAIWRDLIRSRNIKP